MLARFQSMQTRFVVSGRLQGDCYRVMEQLGVPVGFEDLFMPIPEALFRKDVSSTELRQGD